MAEKGSIYVSVGRTDAFPKKPAVLKIKKAS
jgi:hypothetical protein